MNQLAVSNSFWSRVSRRLRKNHAAMFGLVLVLGFICAATFANVLAHYPIDYAEDPNMLPSREHWLGTDSHGKDVLTRVIHGSRLSLLAGTVSIVLAIVIGVPLGAIAGYSGKKTDQLIMRSIDVALAFPSILIALLVMAALNRGWSSVIIAVGLINIPIFARQIRATVITLKNQDYVTAAIASGANTFYVLTRVLFPGITGPLIVLGTLGLGSAILEVAGLSFLGIGGDPTIPEWGGMLTEAKGTLTTTIWPALAPGIAISLSILGLNLLGDGLRDALDPKLNHNK
ncbi:MAG: peptide ABC transporter permease [Blastopirellula sp.]|nr:MAG: peptide ABC transporter permease [Blastopirellula sp.]